MSLKLYTHPANFHAFPALIAAAYNGVRLEVPKFDPATDASTPEFLAKSPLGKSPLLDTEQGSVFEPNAIARYIARLRRDTDLLGSTFFESGQVDQWLDFSTNELEAPRHIVLHLSHDASAYNSAKADIMTALKVLNNWLSTRQFLVGNKVTLADIVLVSALVELFRHSIAPAARDEIVNVTRWFNTCVNQPEFRHVLGDVQLAAKEVKGEHGTAKAAETKPFQASAAAAAPAPAAAPAAAAKDEDSFSFDDDEDDGAAAALIAKKKEEEEKKKKENAKAAPVGKSTVVLDVSPMEAETDLDELEKAIRSTVKMEGLVWGASDRIPVAYGVKKIRILSTIVDDLVSVDDMQEQIEALDGCQSTTIFSFNKV